jgi:hypothetical protein
MINIYKLENETWLLIEQCDEEDLISRLADLRDDGNTYMAEKPTPSGSEALWV